MSTFGRSGPDERYKRINDNSAVPSAPASAGGEPRGVEVRGMDLNLIALGATYIDALCLNSIQGMYVARRQQNGLLHRLRRQLRQDDPLQGANAL
jgi:hypothetical protein